MNIISMVKFISAQPLNQNNKLKAIVRYLKWQLSCRINAYPVIYPFTERCSLLLAKSMTGATGNLYCGLHEFSDMGFLLHFLRTEDHFIDIGANIGSYTVLASGHIGATTTAIEPVPSTFSHLLKNIFINQIHQKVLAMNIALGSKKGNIAFTRSLDTMNHAACQNETDTIQVPVEKLDDMISQKPAPALLKIDVEGFETEVLNGAESILQQSTLKAILIELNGSGKRYGYDDQDIHKKLTGYGFEPAIYQPLQRKLTITDTFGHYNTLYIRDCDFVRNRVQSATTIRVLQNEF